MQKTTRPEPQPWPQRAWRMEVASPDKFIPGALVLPARSPFFGTSLGGAAHAFAVRLDSKENLMQFEMEKTPHRQIYNLLIGLVAPRPIAWVTSMDHDGTLRSEEHTSELQS